MSTSNLNTLEYSEIGDFDLDLRVQIIDEALSRGEIMGVSENAGTCTTNCTLTSCGQCGGGGGSGSGYNRCQM